jgi:hypothetical protein
VLPGDEANGSLIRKLGNAAARFRRTPIVTPPLPPQIARDDRMSAPSDDEERRAAPTREPAPMPVQQAPMPMEPVAVRQQAEVRNDRAVYGEPQPIPTTALVPADERSLPVAGQRPRPLDIAMQIALATRDVDMEYAAPSRRRQYGLAAAGALVIVVGGSLALLARNGSASSSGIRTEPPAQSSAVGPTVNAASPAPSAVPVTHQVEEAGTLLQSSRPETKSSSARMAADTPRPKAPVPAVQKPASGAPRNEPVLPAGPLPNVRVAMPGATPDLKIVSPEMLVDVRTRLTNGQDQLEQGDFAVARRTFRLAVQQLDSIAARYPESEKIRGLRRDLDQADARALQACGAVNEMRKRRGEQGKACQ